MAKPGRKPLTNEQKAARGDTRPSQQNHSIVEFPLVAEVPKPPLWIKFKAGKDLWNDLAPKLYAQRVLTEVDVYALAHLCHLHGRVVDGYRRQIEPTAADMTQLRLYFSEFGMTPSSRTRVGAGGKGEGGNKFKNNGRSSKPE